MIDWKSRAEAAELALRSVTDAAEKLRHEDADRVEATKDMNSVEYAVNVIESAGMWGRLAAKAQAALQAKEQELAQWKEAIIDAAVVDWVYTKEHETNPRKAIADLIGWNCKVALDPKVSKPAADLVAQARQQAIEECARIVFDEGYEAVAHRLRSLTPPPALTKEK